jgi:hypothetical protein
MKKYLLILFMALGVSFLSFGQEDETEDASNKLQQRMALYIQKRLGLSKAESQRFSPIFLRYITELRKTHRENRADKPMLQLRVAELRIRFREEFRQIMDEQRANKVYEYQREFELKIVEEIKQRRLENRTGPRRNRNVTPGL